MGKLKIKVKMLLLFVIALCMGLYLAIMGLYGMREVKYGAVEQFQQVLSEQESDLPQDRIDEMAQIQEDSLTAILMEEANRFMIGGFVIWFF